MPVLSNPRYEAMAKGLADGKSQEEAYVAAGYSSKGARQAASKLLLRSADILRRRDELIRQREQDAAAARAQAVAESSFDRRKIIATLEDIVARSMQYRPVLDEKGKCVMVETADGELAAAYVFDGKVATNALKLLGQEQPIPMFVKREERQPSLLDGLSAEFVRLFRARLEASMRQSQTITLLPESSEINLSRSEERGSPKARSAKRINP